MFWVLTCFMYLLPRNPLLQKTLSSFKTWKKPPLFHLLHHVTWWITLQREIVGVDRRYTSAGRIKDTKRATYVKCVIYDQLSIGMSILFKEKKTVYGNQTDWFFEAALDNWVCCVLRWKADVKMIPNDPTCDKTRVVHQGAGWTTWRNRCLPCGITSTFLPCGINFHTHKKHSNFLLSMQNMKKAHQCLPQLECCPLCPGNNPHLFCTTVSWHNIGLSTQHWECCWHGH